MTQTLVAHECHIRDSFADRLATLRPHERLLKTEVQYDQSRIRADMRTVDEHEVWREWEFKVHADYTALGQVLIYVAMAREAHSFRPVRGVIAALTFQPELVRAVEIMNLNLELVTIPPWLSNAGRVPVAAPPSTGIYVPQLIVPEGDLQ